jgi:hypothetical protein
MILQKNTLVCIEKDHDIYTDIIYIEFQLVIRGSKVKSLFIDNYHHNYISKDFLFPCGNNAIHKYNWNSGSDSGFSVWDGKPDQTYFYFDHYSQTWKILQNPDEKLPALIDIQIFIRQFLNKLPYTHKYYRNKFVYPSLENNLPVDTINIIKTYLEPHKYKETKRILSQHIIDKIVSY